MKLKYILTLIFLIVIIGGGILGYQYWWLPKYEIKPLEIQLPKEIATKTNVLDKDIFELKLQDFNKVKDFILYYINRHSNNPDLLEKLRKKEIVVWAEKADLTNDGQEEIIVGFLNLFGERTMFGYFYSFLIFSKKGQFYEISHIKEMLFDIAGLVHFIDDMNNDGKLEVAVFYGSCGAAECQRYLSITQFDGQEWRSLGLNTLISYPEFEFKDKDNDGSKEIIVSGHSYIAKYLGRKYSEIFSFRDGKYRLIDTIREPCNVIYHLMIDANIALKENNFNKALKLTTQAIQNPNNGLEFGFITERDQTRIISYSAIMLMLIHLKQSPPDLDSVNSFLQEITQKYNKFDNPYIKAAQILRDTYLATKDVQKACQAMEDEILGIEVRGRTDFLRNYRMDTERLSFEDLCPWPSNF